MVSFAVDRSAVNKQALFNCKTGNCMVPVGEKTSKDGALILFETFFRVQTATLAKYRRVAVFPDNLTRIISHP